MFKKFFKKGISKKGNKEPKVLMFLFLGCSIFHLLMASAQVATQLNSTQQSIAECCS